MLWDVIICFFFFGFCGWVCECIFCSVPARKFVNRGFVSGPICPIYGFGGILVVYLLAPLQNHLIVLFFAGMIAATALEYVTSFLLEKLFQTSWWDYHDLRFNINGRVCLRFSLMFGGLSVIAVKLLHPPFVWFAAVIPTVLKPPISILLTTGLLADSIYTAWSIFALNGKLEELNKLSEEIRQRIQESGKELQEYLEHLRADRTENASSLRQALESLSERLNAQRSSTSRKWQHRRLMDAFPRMKSLRNQEQLSELKRAWQEWRRSQKKKSEN